MRVREKRECGSKRFIKIRQHCAAFSDFFIQFSLTVFQFPDAVFIGDDDAGAIDFNDPIQKLGDRAYHLF